MNRIYNIVQPEISVTLCVLLLIFKEMCYFNFLLFFSGIAKNFSKEPTSKDAYKGGVARFECSIRAEPVAIYKWHRNDTQLPQDDERYSKYRSSGCFISQTHSIRIFCLSITFHQDVLSVNHNLFLVLVILIIQSRDTRSIPHPCLYFKCICQFHLINSAFHVFAFCFY